MTLYIDTKPTLEWVNSLYSTKMRADIYEIKRTLTGRWLLMWSPGNNNYHETLDQAKAAAQADYERRTAERFRPIELPPRMNARQGDGSVHYCAGWNDVLDAIAKERGEAP